MKRILLLVSLVLALPSLACSLSLPNSSVGKTGPTQTLTINEAAPTSASSATPVNVLVQMGAGELKLQGGAKGLAEGEIQYNIADWKPTVSNKNGQLTIQQGSSQGVGLKSLSSDVINTWDLKLGSVPMNLTVNAGAYKGQLDLSGLPLRGLTIASGAGNGTLTFDKANPEIMTNLVFEAGASAMNVKGLGFANFEKMDFKGGAGDFQLDFEGTLQRDGLVSIETGVSSLRITIPAGTNAKVVVKGDMKNVKTEGTWSVTDTTYETGKVAGYTLTIEVSMGVGNLTLVTN